MTRGWGGRGRGGVRKPRKSEAEWKHTIIKGRETEGSPILPAKISLYVFGSFSFQFSEIANKNKQKKKKRGEGMRVKTELLRQSARAVGEGRGCGLQRCGPPTQGGRAQSRSPRGTEASRIARDSHPRPRPPGLPRAAAHQPEGSCGSAVGWFLAPSEPPLRSAHLMCVKCTSAWGAGNEAREPQALRSAAGTGPSRCTSAIFYTVPLPPPPPPPLPPQAPDRK